MSRYEASRHEYIQQEGNSLSIPNWTGLELDTPRVTIPARFIVCPTCGGKGTHVNPAIDENGLTAEDFDRAGEDFREDYLSGVYDIRCAECYGDRVVMVPDKEKIK